METIEQIETYLAKLKSVYPIDLATRIMIHNLEVRLVQLKKEKQN